jgi:hypothetical protein
VFSDDHLAAEVSERGRLDQLLSAADADDRSFAVDPALIEELRTMKSGYMVLHQGGASEGSGQAVAARWLDRFDALKSDRDGFRLLYGSRMSRHWFTPDRPVCWLGRARRPGVDGVE